MLSSRRRSGVATFNRLARMPSKTSDRNATMRHAPNAGWLGWKIARSTTTGASSARSAVRARGRCRVSPGVAGCEVVLPLEAKSLLILALYESQGVAVGIIDVELARPPGLVDRPFMHFFGRVWISGCRQVPLSKLAEERVDVVCRDDDRPTKYPVPAMTRQEESISIARENAARWIARFIIASYMLEIEEAEFLCERLA